MDQEIIAAAAVPACKSHLGLPHGPVATTKPEAAHLGIQWRHLLIACSVHRKSVIKTIKLAEDKTNQMSHGLSLFKL